MILTVARWNFMRGLALAGDTGFLPSPLRGGHRHPPELGLSHDQL
jgi:hypothetical protein